ERLRPPLRTKHVDWRGTARCSRRGLGGGRVITAAMFVIPLLGAALSAFSRSRRAVTAVALLSTMAPFALALFLPGAQAIDRAWLPALGSSLSLDPNGAAAVLVVVAALVMIPTALTAGLRVEQHGGRFVALLLLSQAGLNGIFMARDMLVFYLFWEATLIPSLILLGAFGLERRSAA